MQVLETRFGAHVKTPTGEFLVQELIGGKASDTAVVAKLVGDALGFPVTYLGKPPQTAKR